jgi:hypothetical protein
MQYEKREIILLAETYLAEYPDIRASRLSREIFGHDKFFARVFAGDDCLSESGRLASRWFEEHWPPHLPWPAGLRRLHGGPTDRDRARRAARTRRADVTPDAG